MANTPEIVKDIKKVLTSLEDHRRPFEPMVDDILTYVYHGRRKVNDRNSSKGRKTGIQTYDSTALDSVNLVTDGLTGNTISKSFNWFKYTLPQRIMFSRTSVARGSSGRRLDDIPEVKRWLEDAEEVMYSAFLSSNLYDVGPDFVRDAITIGTVTIDIDEDIENARTVFTVPHFREGYCAENEFGQIDTHFRVYNLTLKQLVTKFGWEKMTEDDPTFEKEYNANMHAEREVIRARYPRKDFNPQKMDQKNKPFASVWILKKPEKLLKESGTDFQSFTTWRWRKNSDEWYGRSPVWDAFVDIMTANQQAKSNLIAGHKMAEPPMVGPEDLRGRVNNSPKGWTWTRDMSSVPQPLNTGIQLPFSLDQLERTEKKIRDHLQVDFFILLSQAAMQRVELRELQVIEMSGEKAAVLGQRIGRMETEALNPIHDTVFAIEQRAGRIPDPPDILMEFSNGRVEVEHLGPLSQAQRKLFKTQGIQQGLAAAAPIIELFPETADRINPDKLLLESLTSVGFPQKILNDDETVKQIRLAKQQKEEQQLALEQTIQTAKAMPAAGKAIEENSPVDLLMKGEE